MIRAVLLLSLAYYCIKWLFLPLLIIQVIRYTVIERLREELDEFLHELSVEIDKVFGFLIFGVRNHTVSALVYKKNVVWAIEFIDLIFQEDDHCYKAYMDEFN